MSEGSRSIEARVAGHGVWIPGKDDIVGNVSFCPSWYSDPADVKEVDWDMVYQRYWKDKVDDVDRQRRKQAEFLRSGTAWPRFRNMAGRVLRVICDETSRPWTIITAYFDRSLRGTL